MTLKCLLESFQKEIFVSGKEKMSSLANTDVGSKETAMVKNNPKEQIVQRVSKEFTFPFFFLKTNTEKH